jgi:hypothetical protein
VPRWFLVAPARKARTETVHSVDPETGEETTHSSSLWTWEPPDHITAQYPGTRWTACYTPATPPYTQAFLRVEDGSSLPANLPGNWKQFVTELKTAADWAGLPVVFRGRFLDQPPS